MTRGGGDHDDSGGDANDSDVVPLLRMLGTEVGGADVGPELGV